MGKEGICNSLLCALLVNGTSSGTGRYKFMIVIKQLRLSLGDINTIRGYKKISFIDLRHNIIVISLKEKYSLSYWELMT